MHNHASLILGTLALLVGCSDAQNQSPGVAATGGASATGGAKGTDDADTKPTVGGETSGRTSSKASSLAKGGSRATEATTSAADGGDDTSSGRASSNGGATSGGASSSRSKSSSRGGNSSSAISSGGSTSVSSSKGGNASGGSSSLSSSGTKTAGGTTSQTSSSGGGGDFSLTSPNHENGAMFASKYTCADKGFNASILPELHWTPGPPDTKSYAITFIDVTLATKVPPDVRGYHWVIYNIPANVTSLPEGLTDAQVKALPAKENSAFLGPCPNFGSPAPTGPNTDTYEFTLYALSSDTISFSGSNVVQAAEAELESSYLAKTKLTGTSNAAHN